MLTMAVPAALALKVIRIIVPDEPVYPPGTPPANVIVPLAFEYVGATGHKLKIPACETPVTSNKLLGNEIVAWAALISALLVLILTETLKLSPIVCEALAGLKKSVAALTVAGTKRKIASRKKIMKKRFLMN
jgi:hypothetical protein